MQAVRLSWRPFDVRQPWSTRSRPTVRKIIPCLLAVVDAFTTADYPRRDSCRNTGTISNDFKYQGTTSSVADGV